MSFCCAVSYTVSTLDFGCGIRGFWFGICEFCINFGSFSLYFGCFLGFGFVWVVGFGLWVCFDVLWV